MTQKIHVVLNLGCEHLVGRETIAKIKSCLATTYQVHEEEVGVRFEALPRARLILVCKIMIRVSESQLHPTLEQSLLHRLLGEVTSKELSKPINAFSFSLSINGSHPTTNLNSLAAAK